MKICNCGTRISSSANIKHPKCGKCSRLERESSVKSKSTDPRCATVLGIKTKVETFQEKLERAYLKSKDVR